MRNIVSLVIFSQMSLCIAQVPRGEPKAELTHSPRIVPLGLVSFPFRSRGSTCGRFLALMNDRGLTIVSLSDFSNLAFVSAEDIDFSYTASFSDDGTRFSFIRRGGSVGYLTLVVLQQVGGKWDSFQEIELSVGQGRDAIVPRVEFDSSGQNICICISGSAYVVHLRRRKISVLSHSGAVGASFVFGDRVAVSFQSAAGYRSDIYFRGDVVRSLPFLILGRSGDRGGLLTSSSDPRKPDERAAIEMRDILGEIVGVFHIWRKVPMKERGLIGLDISYAGRSFSIVNGYRHVRVILLGEGGLRILRFDEFSSDRLLDCSFVGERSLFGGGRGTLNGRKVCGLVWQW